jgi:hypothetical protein
MAIPRGPSALATINNNLRFDCRASRIGPLCVQRDCRTYRSAFTRYSISPKLTLKFWKGVVQWVHRGRDQRSGATTRLTGSGPHEPFAYGSTGGGFSRTGAATSQRRSMPSERVKRA